MAWKTKNNKPMPQEEVYKRIRSYGYEPIDDYVNNRTRLQCWDKDGYIVKLTVDSLGKCKSYQRFSPTCNEENFMFNLIKWGEENNYPSKPISYHPSMTPKHTDLVCICECGNEFEVDFVCWNRGDKIRCNNCTSSISNIERKVKEFLEINCINFISQKRFADCVDVRTLPFDFYLVDYNICIEVDGEQHFRGKSRFYKSHKKGSIEDRIRKDNIKTEYCKNNNIDLIRLKYDIVRNNQFEEILKTKLNIH